MPICRCRVKRAKGEMKHDFVAEKSLVTMVATSIRKVDSLEILTTFSLSPPPICGFSSYGNNVA